MIALALALIAIIGIRLSPDAFISRLVDRWLVRPIAGYLNKLDRRHLIFVVLILLVMLTAGELLAAFGPLDAGLILMWDVASFADAIAATVLAASIIRLKPIVAQLRLVVSRWQPRRRQRRDRSGATTIRAANDEDGPAPALAA
ncbi:hypothetical protein ACLB0R_10020 [Sphingomonas sp. GlSt437]|uniref:hypothetical protein n=1 Tax=Sphingomonas sp. GlSt437 TaxID=3389970 RepID=UPI003A8AB58C